RLLDNGRFEIQPLGDNDNVRRVGFLSLGKDRAGNVWAGSVSGLLKIGRNGFTGYQIDDGLQNSNISALFEDHSGALFAVTDQVVLNRFNGTRFETIRPSIPENIRQLGWGSRQLVVEDRVGEWWVPTAKGLLRYARPQNLTDLARQPPKA